MKTAVGVIAIDDVEPTTLAAISPSDARAAGFPSKKRLAEALAGRSGTVHRISLRYLGADPRIALRERPLDRDEAAALRERLARSPWALSYLELIAERPATRAAELAASLDLDKPRFKARVRKLKELGLTISLERGYALSPRGRSLLAALRG